MHFKRVIGIDEVGRGPLAGMVCLGGSILTDKYPILTYQFSKEEDYQAYQELKNVKDSKKISEKNRYKIVDFTTQSNIKSQVLSASPRLIDEFGIGVCLSHILGLIITLLYEPKYPTKIIIDGKIKLLEKYDEDLIKQLLIENDINLTQDVFVTLRDYSPQKVQIIRENKADDKYLSVAIASNLAKYYRDQKMFELHQIYPEYNWKQNKGYGTKTHREAIFKNPENIHLRRSFLGNILAN